MTEAFILWGSKFSKYLEFYLFIYLLQVYRSAVTFWYCFFIFVCLYFLISFKISLYEIASYEKPQIFLDFIIFILGWYLNLISALKIGTLISSVPISEVSLGYIFMLGTIITKFVLKVSAILKPSETVSSISSRCVSFRGFSPFSGNVILSEFQLYGSREYFNGICYISYIYIIETLFILHLLY